MELLYTELLNSAKRINSKNLTKHYEQSLNSQYPTIRFTPQTSLIYFFSRYSLANYIQNLLLTFRALPSSLLSVFTGLVESNFCPLHKDTACLAIWTNFSLAIPSYAINETSFGTTFTVSNTQFLLIMLSNYHRT